MIATVVRVEILEHGVYRVNDKTQALHAGVVLESTEVLKLERIR